MIFLASKIIPPFIRVDYIVDDFVAQGVPFAREYGTFVVGSEHATAPFPYWPILLVVAILIPLMIVAFNKNHK